MGVEGDVFRMLLNAIGAARGFDVALEIGPLQREFVGSDVEGTDKGRDEDVGEQDDGAGDGPLAASDDDERGGEEGGNGLERLERQADVLLDVVEAGHEIAVIGVEEVVAAEPEVDGKPDEEQRDEGFEEDGFEAAESLDIIPFNLAALPEFGEAKAELPEASGGVVDDGSGGGAYGEEGREAFVEGELKEVEAEGFVEDGIAPCRGDALASPIACDGPAVDGRGREEEGEGEGGEGRDASVGGVFAKAGAGVFHASGVSPPEDDGEDQPLGDGGGPGVEPHAIPGVDLAEFVPPVVVENEARDGAAGEEEDDQQDEEQQTARRTAAGKCGEHKLRLQQRSSERKTQN